MEWEEAEEAVEVEVGRERFIVGSLGRGAGRRVVFWVKVGCRTGRDSVTNSMRSSVSRKKLVDRNIFEIGSDIFFPFVIVRAQMLASIAEGQGNPSFGKLVVIKRNGEEGTNAFKIRKAATIGR